MQQRQLKSLTSAGLILSCLGLFLGASIRGPAAASAQGDASSSIRTQQRFLQVCSVPQSQSNLPAIGILDTGVNPVANMNLIGHWGWVTMVPKGTHGTHVAATASGMLGVFENQPIFDLNIANLDGDISVEGTLAAVRFAKAHAEYNIRVLVASWGQEDNTPPTLQAAIDEAGAADPPIFFVAGLGNDKADLDRRVDEWQAPNWNLIRVVTTSNFSDYIPETLAYDSATSRHWADVAAPGPVLLPESTSDIQLWGNGNSLGVPIVAAEIAMLLAKGVYPREIRRRIIETGDPIPGLDSTTFAGTRINFDRAAHDDRNPAPSVVITERTLLKKRLAISGTISLSQATLSWVPSVLPLVRVIVDGQIVGFANISADGSFTATIKGNFKKKKSLTVQCSWGGEY